MNRTASATWRGSCHPERGPARGAFVEQQIGIHPDELVAAAVLRCFIIELVKELSSSHYRPSLIEGTAEAAVDDTSLCGVIRHFQLDIRATVSELSPEQFIHATLAAKANSPIAQFLHTTISITAHLERE